jgi:VIT1/CCC1 family predicted Fe2+/Mn2+ transporter
MKMLAPRKREKTSPDAPYQDEHVEDAGSGVLRASVFGVSDGLVSNLGLIMGVAGASQEASTIVIAGVAGLLAGAFSMAAGEWVSMKTQREVFERELAVERQHILAHPHEEQAHLTQLLVDNGLDAATAARVAAQVHEDVEPAVDFHARFELGLNPAELGSPAGAAISSFLSFIVGAFLPILPWFFTDAGLVPSIVVSAAALVLVGALLTRVTDQSLLWGSLRQLLIGAAAAGVTYTVGLLVGVTV